MSRILLVEDNRLNRKLAHDILKRRGHEIVEATSAGEARLRLAEARPDVVLLDIHLPDGSGEQILQEIRSNAALADLPVVALTASAMQGERERLLGLGFDGYMSKPIDTRAFGPAVEAFAVKPGSTEEP